MAVNEPTETQSLALWCTRLPSLRAHAKATGVIERLERDIARIRHGGSARRAARKWLQDEDPEITRTWSDRISTAMAGIPGATATTTVSAGRYSCPVGKCDRTAGRDEQGHPPVCTAFDTAMWPVG